MLRKYRITKHTFDNEHQSDIKASQTTCRKVKRSASSVLKQTECSEGFQSDHNDDLHRRCAAIQGRTWFKGTHFWEGATNTEQVTARRSGGEVL